MGKSEVLELLSKHSDSFLSIEEISKLTGMHQRRVYSAIKALGNELMVKQIRSKKNPSQLLKVYCYDTTNKGILKVLDEFRKIKGKLAFEFNADIVSNVMLIAEMRELRKDIDRISGNYIINKGVK